MDLICLEDFPLFDNLSLNTADLNALAARMSEARAAGSAKGSAACWTARCIIYKRQTDTDVVFVILEGCCIMVLISSSVFLMTFFFSFSEYVCMCDYSMRVCFLMWWFCWFGHHRGIKVENYTVLFLFFLFTVSFELTRLIIIINNIIVIIYFIQMFVLLF